MTVRFEGILEDMEMSFQLLNYFIIGCMAHLELSKSSKRGTTPVSLAVAPEFWRTAIALTLKWQED